MGEISAAGYLLSCKRRFGTANPERMRVPVWEWMVSTGQSPYAARQSLGLGSNDGAPGENPDWCFQRMGAASVTLPDGRLLTIAGEHEDWYDPDFCIYNDVVVRNGNDVEIYGYPPELFPPTDFHTATPVGERVYLIGRLGYADRRGGEATPVFALDTDGYRIEPVEATGDAPGWIHRHRAGYLADAGVIEVTGGQVLAHTAGGDRFPDNLDTYHFTIDGHAWHRLTDTSGWRQFSLPYRPGERSARHLGWHTGDVLEQLGYPYRPYETAGDEDWGIPRVHVLHVDGVRVQCSDRYREIRVVVEGELPDALVDHLLARLRWLAESTHRPITEIVEL